MAQKLVIGNWKLNKDLHQTENLVESIIQLLPQVSEDVQIGIAPAFPFLNDAINHTSAELKIGICGQNVSHFDEGAYTGEVSAPMLASLGLRYCIVGHSERREYFNETNEQIKKKVDLLLNAGIIPIFCCGETLERRNEGNYASFILSQITESLGHLSSEEIDNVIIAYEPIWAIGTGETASPEQAQEVHNIIRDHLDEKYTNAVAQHVPLLYGGSCKPSNAAELFSQVDIDGGLIGGASLNANDFIAIAKSF